jgi:hypothetical protein
MDQAETNGIESVVDREERLTVDSESHGSSGKNNNRSIADRHKETERLYSYRNGATRAFSSPESQDEPEPRDQYLGIHGWIELESSSLLHPANFKLYTATSGSSSPTKSKPKSQSTAKALSDNGKKAALKSIVVRKLPTKANVAQRLKEKAASSKALKKASSAKFSKSSPAPFKPILPKIGANNRISMFKSSRTVAKELEKSNAKGGSSVSESFSVTELTMDDVLLGRGNNLVTYEGNRRYRDVVLSVRDRYLKANRVQKGQIAKQVIETIWRRGGRFLESKDNDQTNWREADLARLLEKTTQALREKYAWKEHPDRPGSSPKRAYKRPRRGS